MSCFTQNISSQYPNYPSNLTDVTLRKCFGSDNDTVEFWATGQCPSAIHDYLYPTVGESINIDRFNDLQIAAGKFISSYYDGTVKPQNNEPIQTIIAELCSSNNILGAEGICSEVLSKLCDGCSRDQIGYNLPYLRLCGCFAPPLPGTPVSLKIECDSLCRKPGIVSGLRSTVSPYLPLTCQASKVCVITDVNFLSNDVQVDGTFNLTERCEGCTVDSPCECIIDSTLPDQIRRLGFNDNVEFRSYCNNATSTCVVRDPATGNIRNVDCESQLFNTNPTFKSSTSSSNTFLKINIYVWAIALAIIFITSLVAISFI
jgi:hypothetical protein